jgi:hypothetical protein
LGIGIVLMPTRIRTPTFHFDADPYPDPTPSFAQFKNSEFFFDFYSQHCQCTLFYLSPQRHTCHKLNFSDIILNFSEKGVWFSHLVEMDTDPDPAK